MHIVITGSTGFLGKETTLALKKNYKLTFIGKKKLKKKLYILSIIKSSYNMSEIKKVYLKNII